MHSHTKSLVYVWILLQTCFICEVRKKFWGYSQNEKFTNDELIKENYIGIRPAPGYPACPDHTEKTTLFKFVIILILIFSSAILFGIIE